MTDAVLCCCRDEEDVIRIFVAFYLQMGFDAVFIVDNGSVDRTLAIVSDMARADSRVRVRRDARLGYERYLSEYYQWAGGEARPRWLFFLDCDEFVLFPEGVKTWLAALPPEINCLRLRQREMYPCLTGACDGAGFLLTTRCSCEYDDTTKDVSQFRSDARVFAGKHRIEFSGRRSLCPTDIVIRHYKYRSVEQARRKERNRIRAQATYTDEEVARMSAFPPGVLQRWIKECRDYERTEGWRPLFSDQCESTIDRVMSSWARDAFDRLQTPRMTSS